MEKRWVQIQNDHHEKVDLLSANLNIDSSLSKVLINRGIDNPEKAIAFFTPSLGSLHAPFLMKDMDKAVDRIINAIHSKEKILIYGDYDVDGTTAVTLVFSFLKELTNEIEYYIPDRHTEGYGISNKGVEYAAANSFSLIIALDCGIKSIDKVDYATSFNIDFIICDHHNPGDSIPNAIAVLDPKRIDCPYPFKELSGCGIGFKLAQALSIKLNLPETSYLKFLDLAMVSIAADMVSITDENRILAWHGLQKLNDSPSSGLLSLIKVSGRPLPYSISDVVFQLAPRINAAGRMGHAKMAVKMLLCECDVEGLNHSESIDSSNQERKASDQEITLEALAQLKLDQQNDFKKTSVVFKSTWHKGVIGIVASRLTETYFRPTIVLTESNGVLTGSARSVPDFDLYEALISCQDTLIQFGGHKFAAGLTLEKENLELFKNKFEEIVASRIKAEQLIPEIKIEDKLSLNQIDLKFWKILSRMAPFGPDNMAPIFSNSSAKIIGKPQLMGDKHLKFWISENGSPLFECIAFGQYDDAKILESNNFSIAFSIEEKVWKEKKSLQLNIKAIKSNENFPS